MSETTAGIPFEDAVSQLEKIVVALESGELSLDECLRQFEEAVALSRHCAQQLDAAEAQIRYLSVECERTGVGVALG
jgi:exodeoxyribonuclease VII small subunit